MFTYIKNVFKDKAIRSRILFVLLILTLVRVLSIIPIPSLSGADIAQKVADSQFLGLLNIFSGGGLSTLSIVMLGVQPYITSSIIMQLVGVLYPKLKEMQQEEGDKGRRKYSQYTRMISLPIAILQGYGLLTLFVKQGMIEAMSQSQMLINVVIITAGAMLMMWLGEVINEKGIGNGTSVIIFAGIVATLPSKLISLITTSTSLSYMQIAMYVALLITFIIVLMGIVSVTEAERPLEVTYSKQSLGYSSTGLTSSYIPLRLTVAGVVPVIFAISLLMFPQLAAQLMSTSDSTVLKLIAEKIAFVMGNTFIYSVIYFALIVIFTFFYTAVTFDPIKTADNLQKSGAFIPGHRPGDATTNYMSDVLTRVTTVGALFLATVALLPIIVGYLTGIQSISVGGTSLLIAVSVIIDIMKKIDAQMTMSQY